MPWGRHRVGGQGYPYPIMICNITQNSMGRPLGEGGTLPGPAGRGGTLLGWVPCWGVPCWGGTQVGQQKEYSLHGGWYASCVHAGGLSSFKLNWVLERHSLVWCHHGCCWSWTVSVWLILLPRTYSDIKGCYLEQVVAEKVLGNNILCPSMS